MSSPRLSEIAVMISHREDEGDDEDGGWVVVNPDDTTQAPTSDNITVSRSLFELRINIGKIAWHYTSQQPTSCIQRGQPAIASDKTDHAFPTSATQQQSQSDLFRVPTEIRLYIYELVFTNASDFAITELGAETSSERRGSVLTLLQTCRRILHEAEPIYFSLNRLQLSARHEMLALSARRRESIRAVILTESQPGTIWSRIKTLRLAPNLESLHIARPFRTLLFENLDNWAIMSWQMETALLNLKKLKEIKVLWQPSASDLLQVRGVERAEKFAQIVRRLEGAIAPSS